MTTMQLAEGDVEFMVFKDQKNKQNNNKTYTKPAYKKGKEDLIQRQGDKDE